MKNCKYSVLTLILFSLTIVLLILLFKQLVKTNSEETFIEKHKELVVNKVTELENENLGYLIKNQLVFFGDDSLNVFEIKNIKNNDQIFFIFLIIHALHA